MKAAGAVLVIIAGTLLGISSVRDGNEKLFEYRQLIKALEYIKFELKERLSPLPQLLEQICQDSAGRTGCFFEAVLNGAFGQGGNGLMEIWANSAEKLDFIKTEQRDEIIKLGSYLGRYEAEEQEKALELCLLSLRSGYETAKNDLNGTVRLRFALPTAVGLVLAIILL